MLVCATVARLAPSTAASAAEWRRQVNTTASSPDASAVPGAKPAASEALQSCPNKLLAEPNTQAPDTRVDLTQSLALRAPGQEADLMGDLICAGTCQTCQASLRDTQTHACCGKVHKAKASVCERDTAVTQHLVGRTATGAAAQYHKLGPLPCFGSSDVGINAHLRAMYQACSLITATGNESTGATY